MKMKKRKAVKMMRMMSMTRTMRKTRIIDRN